MKMLLLSSQEPEKYGGSCPQEYKKMTEALKKGGVDAVHLFVTTEDDMLKQISMEKPDLVFSGIDRTQDSDGNQPIAKILDSLGIDYVGSNQAGLDTALDKDKSKRVWKAYRINTPKYFVLTPYRNPKAKGHESLSVNEVNAEDQRMRQSEVERSEHKPKPLVSEANRLDIVPYDVYPLIVKPMLKGGSRGITSKSIVCNGEELFRQVKRVVDKFRYKRVLAEKYLNKAREFTISIIGNGANKLIMPSELVSQNGRKHPPVLTHSIKDGKPGTRPVEPVAVEDGLLRRRLCRMAAKMFDVCGLMDYARADIMMDTRGVLYAIEINAHTVFESYFLTGLESVGMDYTSTVNSVIYAAILRYQKANDNIVAPNAMMELIPINVRKQLSGV